MMQEQQMKDRDGQHTARRRRVRAAAIVLIGVAGGIVALAASGPASTAQPKPPASGSNKTPATGGDLVSAKRQGFEVTTTANGDLQAKRQIELRSKLETPSTIQFIIPEGTHVKKDDLLVQLNSDQIQQQIDQETPRLRSQEASLIAAESQYQIQINDNETSLRKARLDLELAELQLRQWLEGDVVKRRQDLRLAIDTAELELDRLADRLVRSEQLYDEGFLSKDERDRDEVSYIQAIARYRQARLDQETYETYEYVRVEKERRSSVEDRRAEVERVRITNEIQLANRRAELENQKDQLALLRARIAKLQEQLSACSIKAPQDGLVVYSTSVEGMRWGRGGGGDDGLQIGTQIYPNQLMLALPDVSEMTASVRVHEAVAGRVRPGQRATLRIDAAGGRVFDGVVESIGVMAESGGWRDPNLREYTVKIALNDADGANLKPAMRVEARIVLDKIEDAITVPVQALFSEGAVQYVHQPVGKKFARVPVRVGKRSDTLAEIIAGLSEGTTVLLRTPQPAELLSREWDKEQLVAAGYQFNEQGEIIAVRGGGGGGPAGARRGGQRPTTIKRENADAQPEAPKASADSPQPAPSGG